jgi:tellurite resistance protein TerC
MLFESVGTPAMWGGFLAFVVAMLALDLGVFHRKAHEVSIKEALAWSIAWVSLAVLFNLVVYAAFGPERGLEFTTGYLIEKALAVDNIFVFVVIFSYFGIPPLYQHRVLFWGIIGALFMRAAFIVAGAALIQRFHWIIYLFGLALLVTGIKLFVQKADAHADPGKNFLVRLVRRVLPMRETLDGEHFFSRQAGRWVGTPLLLALVTVELTDVIFAVDSIPAIFAVTKDPFIVFTSNIFAILGLRSMYFLLAGIVPKFRYLKPALSIILVFVGIKMLLVDVFPIPIAISLGVVALILTGAILLSLRQSGGGAPRPASDGGGGAFPLISPRAP